MMIEEEETDESLLLATSISDDSDGIDVSEEFAQQENVRHGAAYGIIAALSAAFLGSAYCYSKKRSGVEKDDFVRAPLL